MPDYQHLANLFHESTGRLFQRRKAIISGTLGDGTTTKRVEVPDSTIHVYFRPKLNSAELWEVRHLTSSVPRWHGWPVLCEYNPEVGQWEVAQTDVDALPGYFDSFDFRYVTEHAAQHMFNEVHLGHDPVWIYRRMIVNLRPQTPEDGSLRVYVMEGDLPFNETQHWNGGFGPDLTASKPASGEVWVTHYLQRDGALAIVVGDSHPASLRYDVDPPTAPMGTVPIAYVALASDSTTVTDAMLWDARRLVGAVGDSENMNRQLAWVEAELDFALSKHVVEG